MRLTLSVINPRLDKRPCSPSKHLQETAEAYIRERGRGRSPDHYISHIGDEESCSSGMKPLGAEGRLGRLSVDFRIQSDCLVVSDGDIPKVLSAANKRAYL